MVESIGALVGKPKKKQSNLANNLLVDSSTLLGVEIEVEGVEDRDAIPTAVRTFWNAETDNSLREGGVELVFSEPFVGNGVVEALDNFCAWAKNSAKVSSRTGLHVHMDVRDMTINEFKLLCTTYAICEAVLYKFVGDKRETNLFCLPWYSSDTELDKLTKALNNHDSAIMHIENIERYSGLNLAALRKFGSIEFRQLKTTFDFDRILLWVNMILSLRKFATSGITSYDGVISLFYDLGPKNFLDLVFKKDIAQVLYYPRWDVDVYEKGLIIAQEFVEKTTPKEHKKVTATKDLFIGVLTSASGKSKGKNFNGLDKWLSKFNKQQDTKTKVKAKLISDFYGGTPPGWLLTAPPISVAGGSLGGVYAAQNWSPDDFINAPISVDPEPEGDYEEENTSDYSSDDDDNDDDITF